ncbi:MAG TPA: hypothetical protein VGG72_10670 [Bryobacteraceae bacterium]|jgi:hypothetical protein
MQGRLLLSALLVSAAAPYARAQSQTSPPGQPAGPDMQQVLQRLDRLEEENRALMTEIRALRQELVSKPSSTPEPAPAQNAADAEAKVEERVEVQEQRTAQLDQEKISTEHKLPLTFTGMLLANTFWTGTGGGGTDNPTIAPPASGPADGGATFRQSVLGAKFDGLDIVGGGKITGSVYADFYGGSGTALNQLMRLRVASVNAIWKNTTVTMALDKPIVAPREPDSLAQVGVSPLTSAGNLWLWQPQVRVEQRFQFGDQAGLRAQAGVYETSESGTGLSGTEYASSLAKSRPGYEGRFEFWKADGENRRFEIAPGFHFSSSRVLGESAPSQIFSIDWLIRPFRRLDFTGQFFQGENVGVLGGLRQGVSILDDYHVQSVGAAGGWAQVTLRITQRLSLHIYGGQEDDRNRDLNAGEIAKNQIYAGNLMYRLGSNVVTAFESSQTRTTYLGSGTRIFPHYDLAVAYLF